MRQGQFLGALLQARLLKCKNSVLRKRGWVETFVPYIGYGTEDRLRILAKLVMVSEKDADKFRKRAENFKRQRGWRNFFATGVPDAKVLIHAGGRKITCITDRRGYIDISIENPGFSPGWHEISLSAASQNESQAVKPTTAKVLVVSSSQQLGIISDIDDTVITTYLPRPFIAAWNSFVVTEEARHTVPGMARFYQQVLKESPGTPIVYISTGSWNTVPFLTRFLKHNGFPNGPLLLTDWGPTNTGWFRSGTEHKRRCLRELARDFPNIKWLLVGDDGQHDMFLYNEFSELQPDHVSAIAIRQLPAGEQVLAHGTTTTLIPEKSLVWNQRVVPVVKAPDGFKLEKLLRKQFNKLSRK